MIAMEGALPLQVRSRVVVMRVTRAQFICLSLDKA